MQRYLFDKKWFADHQKGLLWLLNAPIIKYWFRWILRIHRDCSLNKKIDTLAPNHFTYDAKLILADHIIFKNGKKELFDKLNKRHISYKNRGFKIEKSLAVQKTTDFRTHNKFSKRLFYAFYPIWWTFHQWDMLIANPLNPALNLGFDTLTVYPDPNVESTSVDGWCEISDADWATARGAATSGSANDSSGTYSTLITADKSGATYTITRFFTLYDTSALGAGATISAAIASIAANGGSKTDNDAYDIDLVDSTPASNTAITTADYDQVGSTVYSSLDVTSWVTTANTYNDFTLSAGGRGQISKTGVTKFAYRLSGDTDNVAPASNNYVAGYMADNAGTSSDPKLVITYTASASYTLAMGQGSFTLTGQAVGFTKTLKMAMAQGSYTLTGIATALSRGYTIVLAQGSYVLTGVAVTFLKALKIAMAQGSYTLSGQAVSLLKGLKITLAYGTFTLTGFALLFHGWIKRVKPAIGTWTARTKPSIGSWTARTKPAIGDWTKRTKPL